MDEMDVSREEIAVFLASLKKLRDGLYQVSLITTDRPTLLFRWR